MMYAVFVRTWWKQAEPGSRYYPGLEPCPGPRRYLKRNLKTADEARQLCQQYNSTHKPGKLSKKAEFEET